MRASFIDKYKESHQHPINHLTHAIGIPMIVVSLPMFFWDWKIALGLFTFGWILQFVGHAFEGKPPAFLSNPIFLIVAPVWWVKKFFGSKTRVNSPS